MRRKQKIILKNIDCCDEGVKSINVIKLVSANERQQHRRLYYTIFQNKNKQKIRRHCNGLKPYQVKSARNCTLFNIIELNGFLTKGERILLLCH